MPLERKHRQIAFITPYPFNSAPGQRFRFEMYYDVLNERNIGFKLFPFLDKETNRILFEDGKILSKIWGVLKGFGKRALNLIELRSYDYIFIFREASPVGPPLFEWILSKLFKKKIIYDFDDAIWLHFKSEKNKITNSIKWTKKVNSICKWSYKVSCGNEYLAEHSRKFNNQTYVIPTIVDTDNKHNVLKKVKQSNLIVGWTGTHSTNKLLRLIEVPLRKLQEKYDFTFVAISNIDPKIKLVNYKFIKWKEESEISDLLKIDIGVMPLNNTKWNNGKCGFKAVQYLSLGIPAVVSPVGVNPKIVVDGVNGYLAKNEEEWYNYLEKLLLDHDLREKYGREGRSHIIRNYSKLSTKDAFVSLFR